MSIDSPSPCAAHQLRTNEADDVFDHALRLLARAIEVDLPRASAPRKRSWASGVIARFRLDRAPDRGRNALRHDAIRAHARAHDHRAAAATPVARGVLRRGSRGRRHARAPSAWHAASLTRHAVTFQACGQLASSDRSPHGAKRPRTVGGTRGSRRRRRDTNSRSPPTSCHAPCS